MVIQQRADGDCGICALGMYAAYEIVSGAAAKVDKRHRGKNGLWNHQVVAIAKRLGVSLIPTRRYDLDEDNGILRVRWNGTRAVTSPGGHFVAIREGLVFCPATPAPMPWKAYLEQFDARPCTLLKEQA